MDYRITHIIARQLAIGAVITFMEGINKDKLGVITDIYQSISEDKKYKYAYEVTIANSNEVIFINNDFYFPYKVVIKLEDGKKYVTMCGNIVTMHKYEYGSGFYVNYSEVCDDPTNTSTESYEPDGFAYHYDCGMNILKEYIEE